MVATPKKGRRFGGDAAHQKAIYANLVASMVHADEATGHGYIETTLAKAKAIRPVVEKMVTRAKKGGVFRQRSTVGFLRNKDAAHHLFNVIGPRYSDRNGGYTRILKLGPRQGDSAPMARIEFV